MSASLVGSEMCIRDRASSGPGSGRSWIEQPPSVEATREYYAHTGRYMDCLLYTSDAADDM
eukprot:4057084-Alexandrium_andersonii.AAC.1